MSKRRSPRIADQIANGAANAEALHKSRIDKFYRKKRKVRSRKKRNPDG